VLKKQISVGVIAAGLACGIGSAALAQSANGTTNSTLGSSGAATGTNGVLHSGANKALNGATSDTTGTVLPSPPTGVLPVRPTLLLAQAVPRPGQTASFTPVPTKP